MSLFGLLVLSGCSGKNAPVNVDVAQQTLTSTLEFWKDGETPESVAEQKPSIIVQDIDWTSGAKLIDYEIIDDGNPVDANLIAKVKLKLQATDGKETEKTVTYVVGTSPVLTVFRDLMN
ncbi:MULTISPECIES: hypothetical protein [unclassified Schlesneria]|uniref:hypothetical protein n=1 Tax=Schlesneria TaxID=656899 RepID=UPI002EF882A0